MNLGQTVAGNSPAPNVQIYGHDDDCTRSEIQSQRRGSLGVNSAGVYLRSNFSVQTRRASACTGLWKLPEAPAGTPPWMKSLKKTVTSKKCDTDPPDKEHSHWTKATGHTEQSTQSARAPTQAYSVSRGGKIENESSKATSCSPAYETKMSQVRLSREVTNEISSTQESEANQNGKATSLIEHEPQNPSKEKIDPANSDHLNNCTKETNSTPQPSQNQSSDKVIIDDCDDSSKELTEPSKTSELEGISMDETSNAESEMTPIPQLFLLNDRAAPYKVKVLNAR